MHIMPQTIVGVVALLVAVTSLLSIALSYGLPYGFQHYISYLKAKQEDTVLREFIKRFSFLSILISLISVISLLIFSSALDSFLFHRLVPTEIIQLLGINLFAVEMNALFNGMVMGLQDYRKSAHILIFSTSFEANKEEIFVKSILFTGKTRASKLDAINNERLYIASLASGK